MSSTKLSWTIRRLALIVCALTVFSSLLTAVTVTSVVFTKGPPQAAPAPACTPPSGTFTTFATTDTEIWIFVSVTGTQAGDVLKINWNAPSGAQGYNTTFNPLTADFTSWCLYAPLTTLSSAYPGGNLPVAPGNWSAQLVWNNTPLTPTYPFTVTGSSLSITLTPSTASNPAGTTHTVTATVTDQASKPQANVKLAFNVTAGPNKGILGFCSPSSCTTDSTGKATWTYTGGDVLGTDSIQACLVPAGASASQGCCSNTSAAAMAEGGFRPDAANGMTVTPNNDAKALATALLGPGVTLSGTPTFTGAAEQAGTFSNAPALVGFPSGVILSSGKVADAAQTWSGKDLPSTSEGGPGNSLLDGLISGSGTTNDAAVLTFSFVPTTSTIYFSYTFASAEYPDFVGQFNDVFGFFVNGKNYALIPGTTTPVSINNVNATTNSQYFNKYNATGDALPYGGETKVLTVTVPVNPGQVNTITLAVADARDTVLDSAVFIQTGSFSTTPPPPPSSSTCSNTVTKTWVAPSTPTLTVTLTPGTATNPAGTTHTVTATVTDQSNKPQANMRVGFSVISGPNKGLLGFCGPSSCMTDANGKVTWTYTGGDVLGTDSIQACLIPAGSSPGQNCCSTPRVKSVRAAESDVGTHPRDTTSQTCSNVVTKTWTAPGGGGGGGTCGCKLNSPGQPIGPSGGNVTITITGTSTSSWTVTIIDTWITIVSGGTGTGSSGTVVINVGANTGPPRDGTITISGITWVVHQGGTPTAVTPGCSYLLQSDTTQSWPASGTTSGLVSIITAQTCTWTATTTTNWITLRGTTTLTGNGGVAYTVSANTTGFARSGSIVIDGQEVCINQDAGPPSGGGGTCGCALGSPGQPMGQGGGTTTISVIQTSTTTSWTVTVVDTWIHVMSGSSGSSSGTVTVSVDGNTGPPRDGTMTIGGITHVIHQGGTATGVTAGCSYTLAQTQTLQTWDAAGTTNGSVSVTTSAQNCSWTATTTSTWISIGTATLSGSTSVTYTAAANTTGTARSGTVIIDGQVVCVNQAGATTPGAPAINVGGVVNTADYAPGGPPTGSLAQGSFFSIYGVTLGPAPPVQASGYPLPTSLSGVNVKITQGSNDYDAYLVFVADGQINAILPSTIPLGPAFVTLTYKGVTTQPAAINVVKTSFGVFFNHVNGVDLAIAQGVRSPTDYPLNLPDKPAYPGQYVIVWGTGLGPISGPDNVAPGGPNDLTGVPVTITVGGLTAQRTYAGRQAQFAAVDNVYFIVPAGVPFGCKIPVVITAGGAAANTTNIAITSDGSPCQ